MSIDPAAQYPSPYVGMGNNPVGMVDPDGGMAGKGGYTDGYGNVKWIDGNAEYVDGWHLIADVSQSEWTSISDNYANTRSLSIDERFHWPLALGPLGMENLNPAFNINLLNAAKNGNDNLVMQVFENNIFGSDNTAGELPRTKSYSDALNHPVVDFGKYFDFSLNISNLESLNKSGGVSFYLQERGLSFNLHLYNYRLAQPDPFITLDRGKLSGPFQVSSARHWELGLYTDGVNKPYFLETHRAIYYTSRAVRAGYDSEFTIVRYGIPR